MRQINRPNYEDVSDSDGGDPNLIAVTVVNDVVNADNNFIDQFLVNAPPQAIDDQGVASYEQTITLDVLANDSDPNGQSLQIIAFDNISEAGGTITLDDNGTPTDLTDDKLMYTAPIDSSGSSPFILDTFSYTISDGFEESTATVNVRVGGTIGTEGDDVYKINRMGNQFIQYSGGIDTIDASCADIGYRIDLTPGSTSSTNSSSPNNGGTVTLGGLGTSEQPDILFIIDVSGSTNDFFQGTPISDRSGDGTANTILDAEIAGFTALNQQLIGLGTQADLGLTGLRQFLPIKKG